MQILTSIYYFLLVVWYITAIAFIIYIYKNNYKPYQSQFNERFFKQLPSNLEPGELSFLLYHKIEPEAFTATFLTLIKKGALELTYQDGEYHFQIMPTTGRIKLTRAEIVIRDFLPAIAKMGKFTLTDFANYCGTKKGDSEFLFQYDVWKNTTRREATKKKFYEEKKGYFLVKIIKNMGILLLLVNFLGGYHLFTGYGTVLPILFIPFFFTITYKRTEVYNEEYEKWLSFSDYLNHLKDFEEPEDIHSYTMSALVLKKIDKLFDYKKEDKSIVFANQLNRVVLKCYRHAYLNGNRSITSLWN